MSYICLGCNKKLKGLTQYRDHAQKCKRLDAILQLIYKIPIVASEDIAHLRVRHLTGNLDGWGIWNDNTNTYVKDQSGNIDSRTFKRNANELLTYIISSSIMSNTRYPLGEKDREDIMPFAEHRNECPHCGCSHFQRNRYGNPLLRFTISRFWCPRCKGKFFRPRREHNMTQSTAHVSRQHHYKH